MSFHSEPRRPAIASVTFVVLVLGLLATPVAPAAEITLPGLAGGQLREADLTHGTFVLVVWASWSPHCRDIVARVNRLNDRWADRARISTVVFQESPKQVQDFLGRQRMAAPIYLDADGVFSKKHAVTSLPGLLVFRDGKLAYGGKLPADPDEILQRSLG